MSGALVDALTEYAAALVAEVHADSVPAGATEAVRGTVAVLRSLGASVDAPPLPARLPPPRAVLDAYGDAPMARRTRLAMVAVFEAMRRSVPCDVPEDAIEPGTWLHPAAGGAISALQSHVEAAGEEREGPNRVALRAPTGAGKTHLLLKLMVRSAMPATMAGGVIFFVVPNRATVRQAHRRLMRLVVNQPWYREGAVALYTDRKATLGSARIIMTTYASLDRVVLDAGGRSCFMAILDEYVTALSYHGRNVTEMRAVERVWGECRLGIAADATFTPDDAVVFDAPYYDVGICRQLRRAVVTFKKVAAAHIEAEIRAHYAAPAAGRLPVVVAGMRLLSMASALVGALAAVPAGERLRVGVLHAPPESPAEVPAEAPRWETKLVGTGHVTVVNYSRTEKERADLMDRSTPPPIDVLLMTDTVRAGVTFQFRAQSVIVDNTGSDGSVSRVAQAAHRVRDTERGVFVATSLEPSELLIRGTLESTQGTDLRLAHAQLRHHALRSPRALLDVLHDNGYYCDVDTDARMVDRHSEAYNARVRETIHGRARVIADIEACRREGTAAGVRLGEKRLRVADRALGLHEAYAGAVGRPAKVPRLDTGTGGRVLASARAIQARTLERERKATDEKSITLFVPMKRRTHKEAPLRATFYCGNGSPGVSSRGKAVDERVHVVPSGDVGEMLSVTRWAKSGQAIAVVLLDGVRTVRQASLEDLQRVFTHDRVHVMVCDPWLTREDEAYVRERFVATGLVGYLEVGAKQIVYLPDRLMRRPVARVAGPVDTSTVNGVWEAARALRRGDRVQVTTGAGELRDLVVNALAKFPGDAPIGARLKDVMVLASCAMPRSAAARLASSVIGTRNSRPTVTAATAAREVVALLRDV